MSIYTFTKPRKKMLFNLSNWMSMVDICHTNTIYITICNKVAKYGRNFENIDLIILSLPVLAPIEGIHPKHDHCWE